MKPFKILVYGINFSPEPTGIGKYTGELASSLSEAGHNIRVVTAPPYYPSWRVAKGYRRYWYQIEHKSSNLSLVRCPLWVPSKPTGLRRLIHLFSFAISSLPAVLWQRLWRPHVVIVVVPTLFCVPGVFLAVAGSRTKRILHVQDLELDAAFELGLIKSGRMRAFALRSEKWLLSHFDRVSSISCRMLDRLSAKAVAEHKLMLFPNWVDTDKVRPLPDASSFRREWGIERESIVVLYSGSLGEKQGIEVLSEAAQCLQDERSIQFVVCSDGPAFRRLKSEYTALSNIVWRELVAEDRLNDLLNLADIHLLPQRADAADLVMPSKLTGMMASGRPVIATAASGTQVAKAVEGCGIIVPPSDVTSLVSAIGRLASDEALRKALGVAARQYAVEHLGKEAILSRFVADMAALVARD